MGGEGRIAGTLVGALILGALTNGLVLLNVPSFYEQIVTGLVVIIAVAIDQGSKRRLVGSGPRPPQPQRAHARHPVTLDDRPGGVDRADRAARRVPGRRMSARGGPSTASPRAGSW